MAQYFGQFGWVILRFMLCQLEVNQWYAAGGWSSLKGPLGSLCWHIYDSSAVMAGKLGSADLPLHMVTGLLHMVCPACESTLHMATQPSISRVSRGSCKTFYDLPYKLALFSSVPSIPLYLHCLYFLDYKITLYTQSPCSKSKGSFLFWSLYPPSLISGLLDYNF